MNKNIKNNYSFDASIWTLVKISTQTNSSTYLLSSETLRLPRSTVEYIISQYYLPTDRSLLAEEDETEVDPEPEEADQAARREEMQETDEADDEMNEELVGMVL